MSSNGVVELIVQVESKDLVRARVDGGGAERTGKLDLDELRKDTIGVFQQLLEERRDCTRRELEVLGRHLFACIFNEQILKLFEDSQKKAREKGASLRVQLAFGEQARQFAGYPWEYMYCSPPAGQGFFLSTQRSLGLCRYIPLDDRERLEPEDKPLRVLVVVSEPEDKKLGPVMADPVFEKIKELAAGGNGKPSILVTRLNQPTVDSFLSVLKDCRPHVLHFIGHGQFNPKSEKGQIALLQDDGMNVRWCPDAEFAEYFTQLDEVPVPRLVFLHMCEGGVVDFEAGFAGMAPKLVLAGVEAVVAMQFPIKNEDAINFSNSLYAELLRGRSADQAVQIARWEITTKNTKGYGNRAFGTPVLYLHSCDGIIIRDQSHTETSRSAGGVTPAQTQSPGTGMANAAEPRGQAMTSDSDSRPAGTTRHGSVPQQEYGTHGKWVRDSKTLLVKAEIRKAAREAIVPELYLAGFEADIEKCLKGDSLESIRERLNEGLRAAPDDDMARLLKSMLSILDQGGV